MRRYQILQLLLLGGFGLCAEWRPKHILHLTLEEKRNFINSFDHVFSDCDGVIWHTTGSIKDAAAGLVSLQKAKKSLKFLSNNAHLTDAGYIEKLSSLGIQTSYLKENDIIHPDKTVVSYLNSDLKYKKAFMITGNLFKKAVKDNGILVLEEPNSNPEVTWKGFREYIETSERVDAVILDFTLDFTYTQLCKAIVYLRNPECDLIVGASDGKVPLGKNFSIPGPQFLIDVLEEFSNKKAKIFGKPGVELKSYMIEHYNITTPNRYLFIGDNLSTDISFANSMKFQTLFVLSGVDTYKDMLTASEEKKSNYYADSVADFIQFFNEINVFLE